MAPEATPGTAEGPGKVAKTTHYTTERADQGSKNSNMMSSNGTGFNTTNEDFNKSDLMANP